MKNVYELNNTLEIEKRLLEHAKMQINYLINRNKPKSYISARSYIDADNINEKKQNDVEIC